MIKKLLFSLLLFSNFIFGQNFSLSPNTEISVFTCGRGDQLYSTFGHTALRIQDNDNQLDIVFNYGAFDFRTENFYLKFLKGDLQYFVNVSSYDDFIFEYQMDRREVIEQKIDLTNEQKTALFELLNQNLASSDRFYTYKFIDRNCTNMVSDKLNAILGNNTITKVDDKTITYRELLYPYFDDYFWYKLGINIVFGQKTDEKAEKLFLPVELLNSLDNLKIDEKPIIISKKTVVNQVEKKPAFSFLNSIYLVIAFLAIVVITNNKKVYYSYLFLNGVLGLFLCFLGLYSQHEEVLWNYNALLFNPLFLLIPFTADKIKQKIFYFYSVLLVSYIVIMLNKPHLLLMLPFIITNILLLLILRKKLLTSVK
jgi:hypothetical protein